jgi:hypothetical protein
MKKELDLKAILKKSIVEAQKAHGLLREEEAKPPELSRISKGVDAKDVATRRMPSVQLDTATWGKKGSVEASSEAIEAYMKPLRDGKPANSPQEVKSFLINLNRALGVKVGVEGEPQYDVTIKDASLPQIVSGLVIRQALVSMIHHNKATVAGDLWEGFVAKMLGKSMSSEAEKPIQDIEEPDSEGNLVSLKLTSYTSQIKGSTINLAKALAREGINGVIYLVGLKSKDNNPFRVKFYSFKVTKDNFFHFIGHGDSIESIKNEIERWNTSAGLGLTPAVSKAATQTTGQAPEFQQLIALDKTKSEDKYFDFIFQRAKDPDLIAAANHFKDTVEGLTAADKDLLLDLLKKNESIAKRIKDARVADIADAFFKNTNLKAMKPDIFKSPMLSAIKLLLRDYSEESDDVQLKRISNVLKAVNAINIIYRDKKKELEANIRAHVVGQEQQSTPADIKLLISSFWQKIAAHTFTQDHYKKIKSFTLEQNAIRNLHHVEVDEDYEPIYLAEEKLFISAQNISNLFETYAQPVYDDHYRADLAIRNYFIEDDPRGMKDLEIILKETVEDINVLREGPGGEFKKASELTENKKAFKKPTVDDILDEL